MWQNGPKNRGKKIFFEKFDFKWKYFFTLMMDDGRKWVFGPSQMLIPPIMAQNGPKMAPKSLTLITKSKFTITNNFFGIIMKVAKYDMRMTCKISGRNLKKQKSFIISECGKMDQKSQSKGDIGGNLLSASLEELEPWVDWSLALSDAKMTNFYYKRPLVEGGLMMQTDWFW